MPVIDESATSKGIRSDVPDLELAKKIAENEDRDGIAELAENLQNKDSRTRRLRRRKIPQNYPSLFNRMP